jgi:hypothetical protein
VLPAEKNGTAGAYHQLARLEEDQLRDAAHDAFMAFWRGGERAALWAAYCEAQERYEAYLLRRV